MQTIRNGAPPFSEVGAGVAAGVGMAIGGGLSAEVPASVTAVVGVTVRVRHRDRVEDTYLTRNCRGKYRLGPCQNRADDQMFSTATFRGRNWSRSRS